MPFQCSICDEPSTRICARCTKDACENHLCEKCLRCSDCCECEVALDATPRIAPVVQTPADPGTAPEKELEGEGEAEMEIPAEALSGAGPEAEALLGPAPGATAESEAGAVPPPTPPAPEEPAPGQIRDTEEHTADRPVHAEIILTAPEGE